MPLTSGGNWKALVTSSFNMRDVEVVIAHLGYRRNDYITTLRAGDAAILQSVDEGHLWPDAMRLPLEAVEPLRDALNEYLGKPQDDYRAKYEEARDALAVERRRVDDLLAR